MSNEILIYGAIGDWFEELDAKSILDKIKSMKGDITVRLNSPGGDAFDGIAIMNALKNHEGRITIEIDGLAASAASFIAIGAADELIMNEGAMIMIHNAWSLAMGNADELRKTADELEKMSENIANIYANHSSKSLKEIKEAMRNETWFTAKEAKDFGFNVTIDTDKEAEIQNFRMLSVYNHVPDIFRIHAEKPDSKRELEKSLRKLGYSRNESKAIASKAFTEDQCDAGDSDSEMLLDKLEKAIADRKNFLQRR